ncbi:MAG: hypothetical protein WC346_06100 [Methanogenium sp.]|jgi:hypothetical protein
MDLTKIQSVIGLDLAANTAGMCEVEVSTGKVLRWACIVGTKKFAGMKLPDCGKAYLLPTQIISGNSQKAESRDNYLARRRCFIETVIYSFIAESNQGYNLVCLEGYAYASQSRGLYDMIELSGCVRSELWSIGIPLRIYDPRNIKFWATSKGNAKKLHMVLEASEGDLSQVPQGIPQEFFQKGSKFLDPITIGEKQYTHDYTGPATDVIDAMWIAQMGRMELRLKRKELSCDNLPSHKTKAFISEAKDEKITFFDKPFICRNVD